jgi:hypothetical protein
VTGHQVACLLAPPSTDRCFRSAPAILPRPCQPQPTRIGEYLRTSTSTSVYPLSYLAGDQAHRRPSECIAKLAPHLPTMAAPTVIVSFLKSCFGPKHLASETNSDSLDDHDPTRIRSARNLPRKMQLPDRSIWFTVPSKSFTDSPIYFPARICRKWL